MIKDMYILHRGSFDRSMKRAIALHREQRRRAAQQQAQPAAQPAERVVAPTSLTAHWGGTLPLTLRPSVVDRDWVGQDVGVDNPLVLIGVH